ncbi:HEAT repeat domain-containing protein [Nonomuraea sp. H19]|uniref:HEAT repeat domain-containing protein n=1 Tax=Nonomuraea sp. H19 TaxID=3452206 RepID=UPI003F8917D3
MALTRQDVVTELGPDEIDYAAAAFRLGPSAAPILAELAAGEDVELAAKAASMAGFLTAELARPAIEEAANHADPVVRVAAAGSLERQPALSAEMGSRFLSDPDAGVRKWTLRALGAARPEGVRDQVADVAANDEIPSLRELAREVTQQLPP